MRSHTTILGPGTLTLAGNITQTKTLALTKEGTGTLVLSGNNSYSGGLIANAGTLVLNSNTAAGTGTLTINNARIEAGGSNPTLSNPVSLAGSATFGGENALTLTGVVSETGGVRTLVKTGSGTLTLGGTSSNTFTGGVVVEDGTLVLAKSAGVMAFGGGSLIIGDSSGSAASAKVQLAAANQIPLGTNVTLRADGQLDFQGFAASIGTLTSNGGSIIGAGAAGLGLGGNITVVAAGTNVTSINSNLTLNGSRVFSVADNAVVGDADLRVTGIIANGTATSALTKTGAGTLQLGGNNTYSGGTNINQGTVLIDASSVGSITSGPLGTSGTNLGDTSGTHNAALLFTAASGRSVTNAITVRSGSTGNTLTVGGLNSSGVNTFSGSVALAREAILTAEAGGEVHFSGAISGAAAGGITKVGGGTVRLSGANNYAGTTTVTAGTLQFATRGSLYNGTMANWTAPKVLVESGATAAFNVGGAGEFTATDVATLITLGTGSGGFKSGSLLGLDTTNAPGGNFTVSAVIQNLNGGANTLDLVKLGPHTLTLTGASTYTGSTIVRGGTLLVNGSLASSVSVMAGATLGGMGSVGAISAQSGGKVAIGAAPGFLSTGAFDLQSGAQLTIKLGGMSAGTQYDQLQVNGPLTLGGSLQVSLIDGFAPTYGDRFFIVQNDGASAIDGIFAGLTQGALTYFGGQQFAVSYQGDSAAGTDFGGNDVVLTAVPEPNAPLLLALLTISILLLPRQRGKWGCALLTEA